MCKLCTKPSLFKHELCGSYCIPILLVRVMARNRQLKLKFLIETECSWRFFCIKPTFSLLASQLHSLNYAATVVDKQRHMMFPCQYTGLVKKNRPPCTVLLLICVRQLFLIFRTSIRIEIKVLQKIQFGCLS